MYYQRASRKSSSIVQLKMPTAIYFSMRSAKPIGLRTISFYLEVVAPLVTKRRERKISNESPRYIKEINANASKKYIYFTDTFGNYSKKVHRRV